MKHFISTTLLLLAILLPATANAYDFEVDGIYYNKTSANTVEVTYKDMNSDSYNDTVIIPSIVTYNSKSYSVTAISDSAFYNNYVRNVTIPETVTSIGRAAFVNSYDYNHMYQQLVITCLASIPPTMDGAFDKHEHKFPFWLFFPYVDNRDPAYQVLFVSSASYQDYKSENDTLGYFNWIFCYDGEKTPEPNPSITKHYSLDRLYAITLNFPQMDEGTLIYWCYSYSGTNSDHYSGWQEATSSITVSYQSLSHPSSVSVSYFVVSEGKLPSNLGGYSASLSPSYSTNYDFEESGICYKVINGEASVVKPIYRDPMDNQTIYIDYTGDIVIPEMVRGYNVSSISPMAFQNYGGGHLTSIIIPYSVKTIGSQAFLGCRYLKNFFMPVSVTSIGKDAFSYCDSLSTMIISGEGEWQAGALPETVKTLYIGSGVTGVKGMQVNPEVIYSYATTPPVCDENSFTGYGAELHVPASSLAAYFTAPYWCNFTNIIGDAVAVTDLSLNHDSIEIMAGEQMTLRATVTPANAVPNTVSWITTDSSVATVENGVVTAVKGGECDIVATCQDKQAICHVVVNEILPEEIILNQEDIKIEVGSQFTLTATVLPDNATNKTVTWRTTNRAVATVNNGVVTAIGPGECSIVASCGDKQAICHVIVVEHYIFITLNQHIASLLPNHIVTLTPTVAPVATDIVVTSSNPAVAAARMAGDKIQVVGITEGNATIYVNSVDGYAFSDSCLVEVYTERGDVNCDGFVNISDGTVLIDILLGGDVNHSEENADCNSDGKITISDLTALIDALLGGAPLPEKNYEVINVNGVSFKMMKVQGGTFTMGATPEQGTEEPWNDEWPTHEVTVSSFSIGQTEVTQELWQAVMGSNPSYFTGDPKRPVETVSWDECQQFIATLNQLTGMNFRMPTEAEWEYAARGGNRSEGYKYAGSNDINETAWWDDNAGDGVGESSPDYGTHPVALKKANELGLYDMSGNVWEWCQDWYGPYSQEAQINPTGPETGTEHLYRGGSWINYARNCRVSCRFHWVTNGVNYVGLRLVK